MTLFLSTPSARRATVSKARPTCYSAFLSTPSARRATQRRPAPETFNDISIHALREEGDIAETFAIFSDGNFYPRPPRGGRRQSNHRCAAGKIFLSTPSARRATKTPAAAPCSGKDFYPRPPRGGRPGVELHHMWSMAISIHALREEGDLDAVVGLGVDGDFYPRPPRGGRLLKNIPLPADLPISIHALREEGDPHHNDLAMDTGQFLSTPSARRATGR